MLKEIREQRAKLIADARAILDKADAEKRLMSAEEQAQFDKLHDEADKQKETIGRLERQESEERELENSVGRKTPAVDPAAKPDKPTDERTDPRASEEYRSLFNRFLANGEKALATIPDELRTSLQMDVFTKGGALVPPVQFVAELIQAVDDLVFVRQFARTFQVTSAESLGIPSLDADPADADWTSELATGSEDTAMAFGDRELRPHPVAKRVKVSNKLRRASAIPIDGLVRDRLAYKFGVTHEKAFLTGSGAQQPLGLFTASANGIPTSRDVSTDNTTTSMSTDGLINAKHSLKSQYWPRARWAFHRDGMKQIRKLKDGNGQYIWQPGISADMPDRILEVPYSISEYVPNTFTTGLYVGIIGDLSMYWIADALDMTVQVVDQLYAETNQTGYIGRMETDGAPVLAEAFARVTLA